MEDIITVNSNNIPDIRFLDGGLPHAKGTHCFQVMRASKNPAISKDGNGWTYNHAAMIAYWNNEFYIDYLTDPVSEHLPPSKTMICWSANGSQWSKPVELFPILSVPSKYYTGPGKEEIKTESITCVMHQRMSFYVTEDNRLLATGFYGISPTHHIAPCNGYGVGRVVREIYKDHTFSDMYFLMFNEPAGYSKSSISNILEFHNSKDEEFIRGCEELLSDRQICAQMWEEERLFKDRFTQPGGEAFCSYTLPDNSIVAVYKKSLVSRSYDNGESWQPVEKDQSIETSTGKVWGQRTTDGDYALVYNPTTDSAHRWPIAVTSSKDGRHFGDLFAVTPEVSPHKYAGLYKNLGPQYIRGIAEHNQRPFDNRMHLAYTVNKEDVWTASVLVPISSECLGPVNDFFEEAGTDGLPDEWNIYSPVLSPVCMERVDGKNVLALYDSDPYDRSRAMRIFKKSSVIKASFEVMINGKDENTSYTVDIEDDNGKNPVRLVFNNSGMIVIKNGGRYDKWLEYEKYTWLKIVIEADCVSNEFSVSFFQNGETHNKTFKFSNSVRRMSRILFTSKTSLPFNTIEDCGKWGDLGDLSNADIRLEEGVMYINSLQIY